MLHVNEELIEDHVSGSSPLPYSLKNGKLNDSGKSEAIKCEFSTDRELIEQYFQVREDVYRKDLNQKDFMGDEDEIDKVSEFILLHRDGECLGGARLVISYPERPVLLPLEDEKEFVLALLFPRIYLDDLIYAELGRTVIVEEHRTGRHTEQIFQLAAQRLRQVDCAYLFGVSPPSVARRFRRIYQKLGFDIHLHEDIIVPHKPIYEHLEMRLLSMRMTDQVPDTLDGQNGLCHVDYSFPTVQLAALKKSA